MEWVEHYYSKKAEWFGPTGIFPEHRERATTVQRLCGPKKRVLELGAGAGGAAAAMADLGYQVVAVEVSPIRASHAQALARGRDGMHVVQADFYTVNLANRFDVVCYWDGFGIGSDADQRRLLRRAAREWLEDDGVMLMDVFTPWAWVRKAGREHRLDHIWRLKGGRVRTVDLEVPLKVRYGFDPVNCRFNDEHWPLRNRSQVIKQSIRCYTPSDFLLLLEGTGLRTDAFQVSGKKFEVEKFEYGMSEPLASAESYLVKLVRAT